MKIQIVGGYVLDLYCGCCDAYAGFYGPTRLHALREARSAGWSINLVKGFARCKSHKKRRIEDE